MAAPNEAIPLSTSTSASTTAPSASPPKKAPTPFKLVVMNISHPTEVTELKRQRISCGWNYDDAVLSKWRDLSTIPPNKIYALKTFFWIVLDDGSGTRAGHVCLDRDPSMHPPAGNAVPGGKVEDVLETKEARDVASIPVERIVRVTVLHILSAYQGLGLANGVMDALEAMATEPPHGFPECEAVELDTIDGRYMTQEGPEWRGVWKRIGLEGPREGRVVMDWYLWRGYVLFRREEKYKQPLKDGTDFYFWGVVLRKRVGTRGREREKDVLENGSGGA